MKILFVSDIVGKIGRRALAAVLPQLRAEYAVDVVIANAENIAHGKGVTAKTLEEILAAGVDFCTSGNHILDKPEAAELLRLPDLPLLRPANFPDGTPGQGSRVITLGAHQLLVINLIGQVFMKKEGLTNPFRKLDEILQAHTSSTLAGIVVDFHAETTSEKTALGWYADGRVSAVVGTHTHIPTADGRVLPGGTAYITDAGMTGAQDSVIGIVKEPAIAAFCSETTERVPAEIPETGIAVVQTVLITLDPATRRATAIERVDRTVVI